MAKRLDVGAKNDENSMKTIENNVEKQELSARCHL